MNKKLILVAGYVASGKTTFSLNLSRELEIPCFNKDLIKVELAKNFDINNRGDSKRLSTATFDLIIHILINFMKVGKPLVLESNFYPTQSKIICQLLEDYAYEALTYLLIGDLKIMHKRFVARENSQEREQANKAFGLFDDFSAFEKAIKPLGDFKAGPRLISVCP